MTGRTIAITGASGLLGGTLCAAFAREGWSVRALSRRPIQTTAWFECDLPDRIDPRAFEGVDVVIHAAYSMRSRGRREDERTNISGTRGVLAAVRAAGVRRFVFVSSVSAHAQAQGFYGQSKYQLEQELDPARDLIVRPGLILSSSAGLFARMLRTVRTTGIAPLFGGGHQPIQTVHAGDLADAFVRAVQRDLTGLLIVCEERGLTMRELFLLMGRLTQRRVRLISVPFGPVLFALAAAEALGLRLPVSSDNLRGLRALRHVESAESLQRLGLRLRTAEQSLRDLLGTGVST